MRGGRESKKRRGGKREIRMLTIEGGGGTNQKTASEKIDVTSSRGGAFNTR